MAQYIPKSVVLTEIDRRIQFFTEESENSNSDIVIALFGLKSFLDTFEVKEVDLEKELSEVWRDWANEYDISFASYKEIAKYFFELGLKAQHSSIGIPNIDDIFEENGIDPNSKDAKIFKECYYTALEKLKAQKEEYENRN